MANAVDLARAFRTAIHNFRLYPKEHENVKNSVAQFMEILGPFLAEKTEVLSISVTPQSVLFNGQPPPPAREDQRLTSDLKNSEDTETRAKAAAWLVKQNPIKLAEAGLLAIASNMPLKARKLAATVVQKAGG